MSKPPECRCGDCGYSLTGLANNSACPECGSFKRDQSDGLLPSIYSNLAYTCILSAIGYLIFVVVGPFVALGYGDSNAPEIYGIYTWPLLLGWLAGAAFHFSATFCFTKATIAHAGKRKAVEIVLVVLWLLAIVSVLILFKTAGRHGGVNRWSFDAWRLGYGIRLSFAIVLCTSLVPALLAIYFLYARVKGLVIAFSLGVAWQLIATAVFVGLFACIWLDWTVGLDLHLRYRNKNAVAIEHGLQWAILFAWMSCAGLGIVSLVALDAIKKRSRQSPPQMD